MVYCLPTSSRRQHSLEVTRDRMGEVADQQQHPPARRAERGAAAARVEKRAAGRACLARAGVVELVGRWASPGVDVRQRAGRWACETGEARGALLLEHFGLTDWN